MKQLFKPKFDTRAKITTFVFSAFLLLSISNFFVGITPMRIFSLVVLSITFLILIFQVPISYRITKEEIIIKKIFSEKIIKIDKIMSVSKAQSTIAFTFSSQGVFGYLGKTMDGTISYSTSLKENLLIKTTDNHKFMISPSEIDIFENQIKNFIFSTLKHKKKLKN